MAAYGSVEAPAADPASRPWTGWRLLGAAAVAAALTGSSMLAGAQSIQRVWLAEAAAAAPSPSRTCVGCVTAVGDDCLPCRFDGDCASSTLPAVLGFDVVSFRSLEDGECGLEGTPDFTARYGGYEWRFASAANRDAFAAEPQRYAPKYGGFCAYGIATESTWTETDIGPPVAIASPTACGSAWAVVDGALYLFNEDHDRWDADRAAYVVAADARWALWYGEGVSPVNTDAFSAPVCACGSCAADPGAEAPLVGADVDEHGCRASAGYAWCEAKGACLRAFEGACSAAAAPPATPRLRLAYGM